MKLPGRYGYPKEVLIPCKDGSTQSYAVKWVKQLPNKAHIAECDPSNYVISITIGQSKDEMFKCFIHEVLHAIEFEYPSRMSHKTIYKLEESLFQLLKLNT